jgi:hypothetical protein
MLFFEVFAVEKRAKSFESGRADWLLTRYEPDELPGCSTPRNHDIEMRAVRSNESPHAAGFGSEIFA